MKLVCLDLEGVLVPEIWISLAEKTGIDELRQTTRDNPDYDDLMRGRIRLLDKHDLGIRDLQNVISEMVPLEGAMGFLERLRSLFQIIILSDTFYELAMPLMAQLGWPTLLCHRLQIKDGRITGYQLRQEDPKRRAVSSFKSLNFKVIAAGDSYNDISMLKEADEGILFRPSSAVMSDYPELKSVANHSSLRVAIEAASEKLDKI